MTSELKSPVRKFEDTFSAEKVVIDKFFISAALDVPELVRYDLVSKFSGKFGLTEHRHISRKPNGQYVRYDQAAAVIAAKDAENGKLREALEKIDKGETTAYDEDVGTDITVWMDEEEMQLIARAALSPSEPRT